MLTLYITRHGETEWNTQNRIQGHLDSRLTNQGIAGTQKLRDELANTKFEHVITSPLKRAVETARILVDQRTIPIHHDERLSEISLGNWEGKQLNQIKMMDPIQYDNYWERPELFINNHGENFFNAHERVDLLLEDLVNRIEAGNVLIVTHGVVIQLFSLIFDKKPISDLRKLPIIKNNELLVVNYQNRVFSKVAKGLNLF